MAHTCIFCRRYFRGCAALGKCQKTLGAEVMKPACHPGPSDYIDMLSVYKKTTASVIGYAIALDFELNFENLLLKLRRQRPLNAMFSRGNRLALSRRNARHRPARPRIPHLRGWNLTIDEIPSNPQESFFSSTSAHY